MGQVTTLLPETHILGALPPHPTHTCDLLPLLLLAGPSLGWGATWEAGHMRSSGNLRQNQQSNSMQGGKRANLRPLAHGTHEDRHQVTSMGMTMLVPVFSLLACPVGIRASRSLSRLRLSPELVPLIKMLACSPECLLNVAGGAVCPIAGGGGTGGRAGLGGQL